MLTETFAVHNFSKIKQQLLTWANRFSSCSFLDNHQYPSAFRLEECLVAAGSIKQVSLNSASDLDLLQQFIDENLGKWIFGHLSYDLGASTKPETGADLAGFMPAYFFVPEFVIRLDFAKCEIFSAAVPAATVWNQIRSEQTQEAHHKLNAELHPAISRQQYLDTVNLLREHIHRGDCYEINYCQEFFCEALLAEPTVLYGQLCKESPNPFSCYYKNGAAHLLCASPERFLLKKGNKLFSQPIKGTSRRVAGDAIADEASRQSLISSDKERSENVMVVDLVRNDLSRVCENGSVLVDELFGIYSYPQVHQMISTVSGTLKSDIRFSDIIEACFPMGSMTGAPKKRVMELIGRYEHRNRGIFSGATGYLSPNGDFDFNVVIRSLLYNAQTGYLGYWVGSGITWYSQPEAEYEECMLKAGAIKKVLQGATLQ